jgi:hypothetical protein
MKSFKEYLVENKQVYEFKIKFAGDCPKDCSMLIKRALSKFHVKNCSSGKSTPIQGTQTDFPGLANVGVTVFDVCTSYPATSLEIQNLVAEHCKTSADYIKVRNLKEEEEEELNHANDEPTGEALIEKEYEKSTGQDTVGEKHVMSFLKELGKNKVGLIQYKGVNEKILAKKAPAEKATKSTKTEKPTLTTGVFGKVTNPDPRKGK